jgi:receptor-binding and translocation channel-forming TcA subunit of Tc toxin/ABC toxin-like protein/neuraminidase-like protein/PA14 domain-containing protein/virulence plasmid A protein
MESQGQEPKIKIQGADAALSDLLSTVFPSQEKQTAFMNLYKKHEGTFYDFLNTLPKDPEFAGDIANLQFALQAGSLTLNHVPLVRELQRLHDSSELGSLRDLVKLDADAWIQRFISEPVDGQPIGFPPDVPGKDNDEKARNYADLLVRAFAGAFPTAAIAHQLEREQIPGNAGVVNFFKSNPEFEFGRDIVDKYLADNKERALAQLADADKATLEANLRRLERLSKITPDYAEMRVLQENGLDSAQAISRMGKTAFVAKFSGQDKLGDETRAVQTYDRARHNAAMALALVGKYHQAFDSIPLAVLPQHPADLKDIPNWASLFGSLDLCECEHCRSVYSPAAYLVDILSFLRHADSTETDKKALDILLERRPDLAQIELSCENTNTTLPYIDLVNEALENAVAPLPSSGFEFKVPDPNTGEKFDEELDGKNITGGLKAIFEGNQFPLTDDAVVTVEIKGRRWLVTDGSWTYTIRKEEQAANSYVLHVSTAPQTTWNEDELCANPEYINKNAYNMLAGRMYPWNLPFNLWVEEARTYLEHLGVRRRVLMETFFKGGELDRLLDWRIAAEYLGLTTFEWQIITRGYPVRAATTEAIILSGLQTIDGVALADGNVVLVKNQADPKQNGVYVVRSAAWQLAKGLNPSLNGSNAVLVRVTQGDVNHDTRWSLTIASDGKVEVFEYPVWKAWGLDVDANGQTTVTDPTDNTRTVPGGWLNVLSHVWVFLLQSGLTLKELRQLLDTRFVNPNLDRKICFLKSDDPFTCDPAEMTIVELDPPTLDRMHRFVRLWRKLGWSMQDLDRALTVFKEVDQQPELTDTVLLRLSHLQRLRADLKTPLVQMLTWWDQIDTTIYGAEKEANKQPLYDQLFLNRAVMNPGDVAFELNEQRDGLKNPVAIAAHLPALTAALGIAAEDLTRLLDGITELDLFNLSQLYGTVSFCKALKLSVLEFRSLLALWGIDRFFTKKTEETLLFVEIVRKVKRSNFSIAQLDYLYRHQAEPPQVLEPPRERLLLLAKNLRAGLSAIADDNVLRDDPRGELTRQKLGMILEGSVVDQAIAMINGTAVYSVHLDIIRTLTLPTTGRVYHDAANHKLKSSGALSAGEKILLRALSQVQAYQKALDELFAAQGPAEVSLEEVPALNFPDSGQSKISYDSKAKVLRYTGPMTGVEKDLLGSLSQDSVYRNAIGADIDSSTSTTQEPPGLFQLPRRFIADALKGFLPDTAEAEARLLENQPPELVAPLADEEKFRYVLEKLLPYLQDRLSRNLVKQTIGGALSLDSTMAELLLEKLLKSLSNSNEPLITDMLALLTNGLTFTDQASSGSSGAGSACWEGFLLAPNNGEYTFSVLTSGMPTLRIEDKLVIHIQSAADTLPEYSGTYPLKAGQLYHLRLEVLTTPSGLTSPVTELRWSSATTPKEIIPPKNLIPANVLDTFVSAFIRLDKAAQLINGFAMTTREVKYLSENKLDFSGFDLNALPIKPTATGTILFWEQLFDLFTLRENLPAGEVKLIDVFAAPTREEARAKLVKLTGWKEDDLDKLIKGFDLDTQNYYKNEVWLARFQACLAMNKRLGAKIEPLFAWAATEPDESQSRAIKNTARAKYDEDGWLAVAKPIRDALREKQRVALAAYLVWALKFKDTNQLFEYFLIDVEMSSCMLTSRIKQAISSVQLFIQRCQMNLEGRVSPGAIDTGQWKWMKNYRVWEANRKIFLYPENWIEPELRDDMSPFFKELQSELLQNEVTADTAETAFLHYLEKLDAVARLEICGLYHQLEKNDKDQVTTDILHVFGRTRGTPHIYYYRKWVDSSVWTPWEKMDVDIEGNHLIPVVWNRRLYLFWPVFSEKDDVNFDLKTQKQAPSKFWEIQIAWSEYKDGKWSAKKVSTDSLKYPTPPSNYHPPKDNFYFKGLDISRELFIRCFDGGGVMESLGDFRVNTCDGLVYTVSREPSYAYSLFRTHQVNMTFVENALDPRAPDDSLYLPAPGNPAPSAIPPTAEDYVSAVHITPGTFRLLIAHQYAKPSPLLLPGADESLFYEDPTHTFFVTPQYTLAAGNAIIECPPWRIPAPPPSTVWQVVGFHYRFQTFYHPYVCEFIKQLSRYRIEGLLSPLLADRNSFALRRQLISNYYFETTYQPLQIVEQWYPGEDIGFDYVGAYSLYNWELFFHAPLLIADRLSKNQRFEEAQQWFHYVFDPTEAVSGGLRATYFNSMDLTNPVLTRVDSTINFDWVKQKPDSEVNANNFSVRWSGKVMPLHGGKHTFITRTGDGVRLWVNNQPLIYKDTWKDRAVTEDSGAIDLQAGRLYDITMEHYERTGVAVGVAVTELYWQDPLMSDKTIIPQSQLFPWTPYWKVRPFAENSEVRTRIEDLMALLDTQNPNFKDKRDALQNQVDHWRKDPFKPDLIARLRITPYQKAVVMKYLDNLIAWGDQLFRQETIEAINEATLLYVLAAEILGRRPELNPPRETPSAKTFDYLWKHELLDVFSNAAVTLEGWVSPSPTPPPSSEDEPILALGTTLYFCIPKNDKLLGYWDTVADRLFKIRHCMNIEGQVRQLPLFEPPIEPGLLVRAAAAGIDLSSVLDDVNAPLPYYRFNVILQKATELCNDLKSLGGALLAALEKRDAEQLALLRSSQEIELLKAARQVKDQQIENAKAEREALQKARAGAEDRLDHYQKLLDRSPYEMIQLIELAIAQLDQTLSQQADLTGAQWGNVPNLSFGVNIPGPGGSIGTTFGGSNIAQIFNAWSRYYSFDGSQHTYAANNASLLGSWARRREEWNLQITQASAELDHIDKQILAAEIRKSIAEMELQNHDLQTENTKKVDEFMHEKFTNQELYDWMVGQLSGLYFQTYQMVYDIAKRAERAFQHELGTETTFINFGHWDSLKKGLLAGERLYHDLKRLDVAYLDQNKREYEITRHVSLAMLDPIALIRLKETGECYVDLPEALFDMDYPGHYMRRIKSVSLTIPCVTGPYTSVNCTLTLIRSSIRRSAGLLGNAGAGGEGTYARDLENDDPRFTDSLGATQSIATSNAQNDSGLFELNFRDERYLPFEGAGVISQWHLELLKEFRPFDYDTISDVVLHIRYTAREGGGMLRKGAVANLKAAIEAAQAAGSVRLFSVRHEFSTEWARFQNQTPGANQRFELALTLREEHYPFWSRGHLKEVEGVDILARITKDPIPDSLDIFDQINDQPAAANMDTLVQKATMGNLLVGNLTNIPLPPPTGEFKLYFEDRAIDDLWIAVHWKGVKFDRNIVRDDPRQTQGERRIQLRAG